MAADGEDGFAAARFAVAVVGEASGKAVVADAGMSDAFAVFGVTSGSLRSPCGVISVGRPSELGVGSPHPGICTAVGVYSAGNDGVHPPDCTLIADPHGSGETSCSSPCCWCCCFDDGFPCVLLFACGISMRSPGNGCLASLGFLGGGQLLDPSVGLWLSFVLLLLLFAVLLGLLAFAPGFFTAEAGRKISALLLLLLLLFADAIFDTRSNMSLGLGSALRGVMGRERGPDENGRGLGCGVLAGCACGSTGCGRDLLLSGMCTERPLNGRGRRGNVDNVGSILASFLASAARAAWLLMCVTRCDSAGGCCCGLVAAHGSMGPEVGTMSGVDVDDTGGLLFASCCWCGFSADRADDTLTGG